MGNWQIWATAIGAALTLVIGPGLIYYDYVKYFRKGNVIYPIRLFFSALIRGRTHRAFKELLVTTYTEEETRPRATQGYALTFLGGVITTIVAIATAAQ